MEKKKPTGIGKYVALAVIIGAVVAGAYYQEQIGFFFKLRGWDKEAPARTVRDFLKAGQQGDQAAAGGHLGSPEFKPLEEDGKWLGYYLVSNAGTMEFRFDELTPAEENPAAETEFIYLGRGAAVVTLPDAKGEKIRYRLEVMDGRWKITEILGGRPAA